MKISDEKMARLQELAVLENINLRFRDIAYCILLDNFGDHLLSYRLIFNSDTDSADEYDNSKEVKFLKKHMEELGICGSRFKASGHMDISFEENKAEMIEMLKEIDEAVEAGELDKKDATRFKIDIRTKLNDRFKVSEDTRSQIVYVQPKFNHICPHTQKECWVQTKEYAMEHWGLIEKPE